MPMLELEGQHISYLTAGDPSGLPIILIHGWDGYVGIWETTIDVLSEEYFCIALDLLGFGDSDKPTDGDYSIDAQSRRVLALANALDLQHFVLVGHSMGVMIAAHIAANLSPQRVMKLVSVGGTFGGKLSWMIDYVAVPTRVLIRHAPWLLPIIRIFAEIPPVGKAMFRMFFYDMNVIPYSEWTEKRRRVFQAGSAVPSDETRISTKTLNLMTDLHKITAPVLIMHGERDGTVPVEQAKAASDRIAHCRLSILPACGHHPMIERPNVYFDLLTHFLTETNESVSI